jgi:hypothetical protein
VRIVILRLKTGELLIIASRSRPPAIPNAIRLILLSVISVPGVGFARV